MSWGLDDITVKFRDTVYVDGTYTAPHTYYHAPTGPVPGEWWEWEVTVGSAKVKVTTGHNNLSPDVWSTTIQAWYDSSLKFAKTVNDNQVDSGDAAYYPGWIESSPTYGVGFGAAGVVGVFNPGPSHQAVDVSTLLDSLTWELSGVSQSGLQQKVYIDDVLQGSTSVQYPGQHATFMTPRIYTAPNTLYYGFNATQYYTWRVDLYDPDTESTFTGDTWVFTIKDNPAGFNYDRSPTDEDDDGVPYYNPNYVWVYNSDEGVYKWQDISTLGGGIPEGSTPGVSALGGGRYSTQLVVVGHEKIFFGEV